MQVTFKFILDERVTTPFDEPGIVQTCAVGRSGNTYFVNTAKGGDWYFEDQLTAERSFDPRVTVL